MQTRPLMMRARFDKHGRRLPDTGHGCGCRLCERMNAPRYERRRDPRRPRLANASTTPPLR